MARYIDFDRLKEVIHRNMACGDALDQIIDIQPTEDVRPVVRGKWKKYCIPRGGEQHYICSNCNEYVNFGQWGDFYVKDFKYCPHCGCQMNGE